MDLTYRLFIQVDSNNSNLYAKYAENVSQHNQSILHNPYPNSGFDLFFPEDTVFDSINSKFISMAIKCEMHVYNSNTNQMIPVGYYSYPRSSISKTPLLLANSVGIIDSGYRGPIIGAFRNLSIEPYKVEQYTRLLQICAPDLRPFTVELVDNTFFEETLRGEGGFGSTGK